MKALQTATLLLCALALAACGSSSSDDKASTGTGGGEASAFTTTGQDWQVDLPAPGSAVCYDFDGNQEVSCDTGTTWDLKLEYPSGTRASPVLWTNGGATNAAGQGAAFGFFDWADLSQWLNATTEPSSGASVATLYQPDSASSIFTQQSWYAYDLEGTHLLYPNYNVYLVTTDASQGYDPAVTTTYAVQVIGYYGGASGSESGHPTIRWIDVADPSDVRTFTIDATSSSAWVYFDLANGAVVDTPDASNWQVAFRRMDLKLNGGSSGGGAVAGFLGTQVAGLYDSNGDPIKSAFLSATPSSTLDELQDTTSYDVPASASNWVKDQNGSVLQPEVDASTYPVISYGFYSYNGNGSATTPKHGFEANADKGVLLRSGSGDSYARVHLTAIDYADPTDVGSQQTWAFTFDVQPAN